MKNLLFSFLVCMTVSSAFALDVTGLRTEDYHNPVGIDKSNVHFSWQLQSELRGVMQTSYNVQIASDASFGNVVWESGTIDSDKSVFVEASGFTPSAETRYYWRVTVTDNKGESATSTEKAYFETGLMTANAWNGTHWIKASTNEAGSEAEGPITDYEVEVKFNVKQLAAGLIFAASDHSNYYMWQVNTNGSVRFRPHRWSGGNPSLLSEAAITGENELLGTAAALTATGSEYVLGKANETVGFYRAEEGSAIPEGKAYLVSASGVKGFVLSEGGATGIINHNDNLNLNEPIYNLSGQRLQKMQKGINIVGNKKVLK